MKLKKKVLEQILLKMANGFTYTETIEEYMPKKNEDEGQGLELVKKKISTHYVAPDMLAIKMLIENSKEKVDTLVEMTDEELIELKNKLIKEISGGG